MPGKVFAIAITMLASLQAAAGASGLFFTDRALFQAAIGPHQIYTFDTADGFPAAPAPISRLSADTWPHVSSTGGSAFLDTYGAAGNQALTGSSIGGQLDRSAMVTIFPAPDTTAIGFDILDLGALGESATIIINDGGDPPVPFRYHVVDNDGNPATPVFFGVIWQPEITFLSVYGENLICAGPGTCFTPNLIDNLTLVPEPTSLLLVICACAIVVGRRRGLVSARG